MKITFLGATRTVTGSKYLLELGEKKILIDCGLFQGHRELQDRNWAKFPIEPYQIDAVILTHAHLDHSGYLPLLVKQGFTGPIFSTPGTKDLCAILLPDSGRIQEEDAYFANKHGYSKHKPALPLYTEEDAQKVMPQFETVSFEDSHTLFEGCHFEFSRAAHILGSSFVRLTYQGSSIVFSGDIGRAHDPIMREPSVIEYADYLVMESTYGDRLHAKEAPQEQLAKIINETAERGGSVLIPAFAVGRSQSVLYHIAQLKEKKKIPDLPVYLDSPMAESVTDIYTRYLKEHCLEKHYCIQLGKEVNYVNSIEESKKLDASTFPSIIISASGMATGGRVLHHLKAMAPNYRNTVLFTGYQAEGTLGDHLVQGDRKVKIHGEMISVQAKIAVMSNLSAHADYEEILQWLGHFKEAPKRVFITHGSDNSARALGAKIEEHLGWKSQVPDYLESVELGS